MIRIMTDSKQRTNNTRFMMAGVCRLPYIGVTTFRRREYEVGPTRGMSFIASTLLLHEKGTRPNHRGLLVRTTQTG